VIGILSVIIIGISLSMDAFSLALAYGTVGMIKKREVLLSMIVGVFHFFMPLLGLYFGSVIARYFFFDISLLASIIFIIIGLEMVSSSFRDKELNILVSFLSFLLFGLSVSIDSFTTGIGLSSISNNYIMVCFIFAFVSMLFTYFGLRSGFKLNQNYGKYATIFGGGILVILGIIYLV